MKKIAILQSNYIPWKGYFDLIAAVDEFILYDDMQYTRRDWRNRNLIKTPQGLHWLTVPVRVRGKFHQSIRQTEIADAQWAEDHWRIISHTYRKAPHFEEIAEWLEPMYCQLKWTHLSLLNRALIEAICHYLGIRSKISDCSEYQIIEGKSERLADICRQAKADEYVSGPAAKDYIDQAFFAEQRIKLTWFDYSNYPHYPQLYGEFIHGVSIIDLLFNCGRNSILYLKHFSS